jgi:hypothetical protein
MVAGRSYTPDVPRWLAVGLGCVTALGLQALFAALLGQVGVGLGTFLSYVALFVALGLGGYVTGHFVGGSVPVIYGALVAIICILVIATMQAMRDATVAHQAGFAALPPIDFLQLTVTDVLAMTGACTGAWLAGRFSSADAQLS